MSTHTPQEMNLDIDHTYDPLTDERDAPELVKTLQTIVLGDKQSNDRYADVGVVIYILHSTVAPPPEKSTELERHHSMYLLVQMYALLVRRGITQKKVLEKCTELYNQMKSRSMGTTGSDLLDEPTDKGGELLQIFQGRLFVQWCLNETKQELRKSSAALITNYATEVYATDGAMVECRSFSLEIPKSLTEAISSLSKEKSGVKEDAIHQMVTLLQKGLVKARVYNKELIEDVFTYFMYLTTPSNAKKMLLMLCESACERYNALQHHLRNEITRSADLLTFSLELMSPFYIHNRAECVSKALALSFVYNANVPMIQYMRDNVYKDQLKDYTQEKLIELILCDDPLRIEFASMCTIMDKTVSLSQELLFDKQKVLDIIK